MNNLKKLTILYLEDEDNIRLNMEKMLSFMFNQVISASNVKDAKEYFSSNNIDIILSDINMPGENGIEFAKFIRSKNEKIPIILLTAHTDLDYLLPATKLKLLDYLIKPINFSELKEVLIKAAKECLSDVDLIIKFENNIEYNITKKQLLDNHNLINITNKEVLLLEYLFKNKNRTVPKEEILLHIWDDEYKATESALKSLLNKLRSKIGKDSIRNMSRIGYLLQFKQ